MTTKTALEIFYGGFYGMKLAGAKDTDTYYFSDEDVKTICSALALSSTFKLVYDKKTRTIVAEEKGETDLLPDPLIQRIDDIKRLLPSVEQVQADKAHQNSVKEDRHEHVSGVTYSMQEWVHLSNCLQFLYCNIDNIRRDLASLGELKHDIIYLKLELKDRQQRLNGLNLAYQKQSDELAKLKEIK